MRGWWITPRTISSARRMPPDRAPTGRFRMSFSPNSSSSSPLRCLDHGGSEIVEQSGKAQVFCHRQRTIQRRFLEHQADAPAHRHRIVELTSWPATHAHSRRWDAPRSTACGWSWSCRSRSGPSRPKNWPAGDLQLEPVYGENFAVTLGQTLRADGGVRVRQDGCSFMPPRFQPQEARTRPGVVSAFAFSLSLREFLSSRKTIGCTVTGWPGSLSLFDHVGDQVVLGRQIADRIGVGRIAGQHVGLAAAAAEILGLFRAAAARLLHPARRRDRR